MSNKRQQTMAKIERERTVRERRALKLERKQAAAAAKRAAKEGNGFPPTFGEDGLPLTIGEGEGEFPPTIGEGEGEAQGEAEPSTAPSGALLDPK